MESDSEKLFNSSFGLKLNQEQIVRELINFMKADERRRYKLLIGTDSEKNSGGTADFVTAIVIHRVGNGGRYFWRRIVNNRKFHTLRDRILEEVLMSLDVAKELLLTTKHFAMPDFDFEIHVDVGENGATRSMIQELVGMVRAMNFEAKTKPESYAASKVADRHV
ncbi:MAG TPA: ribonuclease H-like YkuK family protein [Candidatus Paceibacterota bacterium]